VEPMAAPARGGAPVGARGAIERSTETTGHEQETLCEEVCCKCMFCVF
jgi:hypothetical protein